MKQKLKSIINLITKFTPLALFAALGLALAAPQTAHGENWYKFEVLAVKASDNQLSIGELGLYDENHNRLNAGLTTVNSVSDLQGAGNASKACVSVGENPGHLFNGTFANQEKWWITGKGNISALKPTVIMRLADNANPVKYYNLAAADSVDGYSNRLAVKWILYYSSDGTDGSWTQIDSKDYTSATSDAAIPTKSYYWYNGGGAGAKDANPKAYYETNMGPTPATDECWVRFTITKKHVPQDNLDNQGLGLSRFALYDEQGNLLNENLGKVSTTTPLTASKFWFETGSWGQDGRSDCANVFTTSLSEKMYFTVSRDAAKGLENGESEYYVTFTMRLNDGAVPAKYNLAIGDSGNRQGRNPISWKVETSTTGEAGSWTTVSTVNDVQPPTSDDSWYNGGGSGTTPSTFYEFSTSPDPTIPTITSVILDKSSATYGDSNWNVKPTYTVKDANGNTISSGYAATWSNDSITGAGTYTLTVTGNSTTCSGTKTATYTVNKATIDVTDVTFENKTVTYNGQNHTIEVGTLPANVLVSYSPSNSRKDAGSTEVTATLTPSDSNNYQLSGTITRTATLTINKATPTITGTISISGWTVGSTPVLPTGLTASIGTLGYWYYTNAECTTGRRATPPEEAGTYWVRGEVAADGNLNGAQSAAVSFAVTQFMGGNLFVTPDGTQDGASWESPASLASAISSACAYVKTHSSGDGCRVLLKHGTYELTADANTFTVDAGISILGGYKGESGTSEDLADGDDVPISVVDGMMNYKLFYVTSGQDVSFARIHFVRGASSKAVKIDVGTAAMTVTFTDCEFDDNGYRIQDEVSKDAEFRGCALHMASAANATLVVQDCRFSNNRYHIAGKPNVNWGGSEYFDGSGAAIYVSSIKALDVRNTRFVNNGPAHNKGSISDGYANQTFSYEIFGIREKTKASVVYVDSTPATFAGCEFRGGLSLCNTSDGRDGPTIGCFGSNDAMFKNCLFTGNGAGHAYSTKKPPDVGQFGRAGGLCFESSGNLEIENCTFFANTSDSPRNGGNALSVYKGTATVKNSIFYANTSNYSAYKWCQNDTEPSYAGMYSDVYVASGASLTASYTLFTALDNTSYGGTGSVTVDATCIAGDPLFQTRNQNMQLVEYVGTLGSANFRYPKWSSDTESSDEFFDLHLRSKAGYYLNDGSFAIDNENASPALDKGDPSSDWSNEPDPNGGRINLGAYGNTSVASMSGEAAQVPPVLGEVTVQQDSTTKSRPHFLTSLEYSGSRYVAEVTLYWKVGTVEDDEAGYPEAYDSSYSFGQHRSGDDLDLYSDVYFQKGQTVSYLIVAENTIGNDKKFGHVEITQDPPPGGGDKVVHVNATSGNDENDGKSWDSPIQTLEHAAEIVNQYDRTQVWIAGDPEPTTGATFTKAVKVYGGFLGNETAIDQRPALGMSTIDANYAIGKVIWINIPSGEMVFDRLTIQEALTPAVKVSNAGVGVSFSDCKFIDNGDNKSVAADSTAGPGASIYAEGSAAAILSVVNCRFENNGFRGTVDQTDNDHRNHAGAAIYAVDFKSIVMKDSLFQGNGPVNNGRMGMFAARYTPYGSVVYAQNAPVVATGCRFFGNKAIMCQTNTHGGFFYLGGNGDGSLFENCSFVGNMGCNNSNGDPSSPCAGGVVVNLGDASQTCDFKNCTFAYNATYLGSGTAFHAIRGAISVRNSIFWGSRKGGSASTSGTQGGDIYVGENASLDIDYSFITDNTDLYLDGTGTKTVGDNMLTGDPLLKDDTNAVTFPTRTEKVWLPTLATAAENVDVHLQSAAGRWTGSGWTKDSSNSPCIDAGDPEDPYGNEPSPRGNAINLGVYGNTEEASMSTGDFEVNLDKNSVAATDPNPAVVTIPQSGQMPELASGQRISRPGKTFDGYWDDQGNQYYGRDGVPKRAYPVTGGPQTLFAHWLDQGNEVTLHANGASVEPSPNKIPVVLDEPMQQQLEAGQILSRTGYTFGGYYDSAACDGTQYYNASGACMVDKYPAVGGPTDLYAKWTPIRYRVHFDGNGETSGSMGTEGQVFTYDVEQKLWKNLFARVFTVSFEGGFEGQISQLSATATFNGWAKSKDGAAEYGDEAPVINLSSTHGAQIYLYAKWTDGSITLPTPTKTGCTFVGWYTAASGGSKVGDAGASYTPTATTTLYAQWLTQVAKPTATTELTYNGSEQTGVAAATGYTVANGSAKNAGDYTATATLVSGYVWADGTSEPHDVAWEIGKKTLKVVGVTVSDREYNGTSVVPLNTAEKALDGVCSGDDVQIDSMPTTGTFIEFGSTYSSSPDVGQKLVTFPTGSVTLKGTRAGNYFVNEHDTLTMKVTQRVLSLTWGETSFVYDGNSHCPTCTLGNFVTGEGVGSTATVSGAASVQGSHTATVTAWTMNGTGKQSNYQLPDNLTTTFNISVPDSFSLSAIEAGGPVVKNISKEWLSAAFPSVDPTQAAYQTKFLEANANGVTAWAAYILGFEGAAVPTAAIIEKTTQSEMSGGKVTLTVGLPGLPTKREVAGCEVKYSLLTSDNAETLRKGGGDIVAECEKCAESSFTVPLSIPTDANHVYYRIRIHFIFGGGDEPKPLDRTGYVQVRFNSTASNNLNYLQLNFKDEEGNYVSHPDVVSSGKDVIAYYCAFDGFNAGNNIPYETVYVAPPGAVLGDTEVEYYPSGATKNVVPGATATYANMTLTAVNAETAMVECDKIWNEITGGDLTLWNGLVKTFISDRKTATEWTHGLTKLQAALQPNSTTPCRILLLGDSLSADFYYGCINAMIEAAYNTTNVSITCQQNNNHGCWQYQHRGDYADPETPGTGDKFYRLQHIDFNDFDLVIFAGTSQLRGRTGTSGEDAVEAVKKYITGTAADGGAGARANASCEFIMVSPLISVDSRLDYGKKYGDDGTCYWGTPQEGDFVYWNSVATFNHCGQEIASRNDWDYTQDPWMNQDYNQSGDGLSRMRNKCSNIGIAYWDLTQLCYQYLYQSGKPFAYFNRDSQHSNRYGKQFAARVVFEVIKMICPPQS